MLLVLFQEVVTSTAYINMLRLRTLGEISQHLQENPAHCISVLTGHSVTSSPGLVQLDILMFVEAEKEQTV
jgi:hypothetical protein